MGALSEPRRSAVPGLPKRPRMLEKMPEFRLFGPSSAADAPGEAVAGRSPA